MKFSIIIDFVYCVNHYHVDYLVLIVDFFIYLNIWVLLYDFFSSFFIFVILR